MPYIHIRWIFYGFHKLLLSYSPEVIEKYLTTNNYFYFDIYHNSFTCKLIQLYWYND